MQHSEAVADALRRFFVENTSGDPSTFAEVVSLHEAVLAVGSTASEWFTGQDDARRAYGAEGVTIDPGEIVAWENGDTGWAVCTPAFLVTEGPTLHLRFSTVFICERGG